MVIAPWSSATPLSINRFSAYKPILFLGINGPEAGIRAAANGELFSFLYDPMPRGIIWLLCSIVWASNIPAAIKTKTAIKQIALQMLHFLNFIIQISVMTYGPSKVETSYLGVIFPLCTFVQ